MKSRLGTFMVLAFLLAPLLAYAADRVTNFEATSLTGEHVTQQQLFGQPTVLIVTPSKAAAKQTREWAKSLRSRFDTKHIKVRDVIAINLPFFISESYAVGRAKQKIPKRYYDQTWLSGDQVLENALHIPTESKKAFVLVLDSQGRVLARVSGPPTDANIQKIMAAVPSSR